jgi:dethiobiotin synthetase
VPDLLVTGTDTGVGKTVIAAALIRAMRSKGIRAVGFKPVETGCDGLQPNDSDILALASGEETPLARPLLQLREPLAPAVAAERAGIRMEANDIEARVQGLQRERFSLVIEGAGGVMVPLAWAEQRYYTVLDLAEHIGTLEAVIVGRAGLGTLNHVVLTAAMLSIRGIPLRAVVLNGKGAEPDAAETTNPSVLSRMLPGVHIIQVPRHSAADVVSATVEWVSPLV